MTASAAFSVAGCLARSTFSRFFRFRSMREGELVELVPGHLVLAHPERRDRDLVGGPSSSRALRLVGGLPIDERAAGDRDHVELQVGARDRLDVGLHLRRAGRLGVVCDSARRATARLASTTIDIRARRACGRRCGNGRTYGILHEGSRAIGFSRRPRQESARWSLVPDGRRSGWHCMSRTHVRARGRAGTGPVPVRVRRDAHGEHVPHCFILRRRRDRQTRLPRGLRAGRRARRHAERLPARERADAALPSRPGARRSRSAPTCSTSWSARGGCTSDRAGRSTSRSPRWSGSGAGPAATGSCPTPSSWPGPSRSSARTRCGSTPRRGPSSSLKPGMKLDLGGIAKGYAAGRGDRDPEASRDRPRPGRRRRRHRGQRRPPRRRRLDHRDRPAGVRPRPSRASTCRSRTRPSRPRATPSSSSRSTASATPTSSTLGPAWAWSTVAA